MRIKGGKIEVQGNTLTIVIEDATEAIGMSASGRNHMFAKTDGPMPISIDGQTVYVNLQVYGKQ